MFNKMFGKSNIEISEDNSSSGDDSSLERDRSQEQPNVQVELEILEGVFDKDKSPAINCVPPEQITSNNEGFTTVSRNTISTSYSSDGKVAASIPTPYLKAREAAGDDVPTLIGELDSSNAYLLLPASARECPQISISWLYSDGEFDRNNFVLAAHTPRTECMDFLHKIGFFSSSSSSYYLKPNRNPPKKWEELIQKGQIQFVDEEKAAKFAIGVICPSQQFQLSTKNIKEQVRAASWAAHFPQKQSLFVHDEKLKLFDWSNDIANNWSITELDLPEEIKEITAAGLDPKDNFLLVGSGNKLYVLDHHKKPMEVVSKLENPDAEFDGIISLRADGSILAGDKKGNLTKIISNLHTLASRREQLEQQKALQRLRIKKRGDRFKTEKTDPAPISPEIKEISDELTAQFKEDINNASSLDAISSLRAELRARKTEYEAEIKNRHVIDAIFNPVFNLLGQKENGILSAQLETEMTAIRGLIGRIESMSLQDLATARSRVDRVKAQVLGSGLGAEVKNDVTQISDTFAEKAQEVLARDEEKLLIQLDDLFSKAKQKLTAIDKLSAFDVWQSTDYPAFLDALAGQIRIVPASHGKVLAKLRKMEHDMREIKKQTEARFKEEYKQVRQQAANRTDIAIGITVDRIDEFLEMFGREVHKKSFRTVEEAKQWVERSSLYTSVLGILEDLGLQDPEKAAELKQRLKVEIAQLSYEVKKMKDATVDEVTGRQMAIFGSVGFSVWEHKVEGKQNVKIELIYKVDNASKGPGVKPEDYMCELFYKVTDENGKVHKIPMQSEDTRKYGRYDERFYEGGAYFPSYLSLGHARKILAAIKAKESKRSSEVTRRYDEFQKKIKELHGRIRTMKSQSDGNWDALRTERANLTKEYISFLHESGLFGWFALRAFKNCYHNGENMEAAAGQGRIPDWEPYWVVDKETEKDLEECAIMAKISLEAREGMISLEGHAGTGKDVLVQMFAHKTKRPMYSFDCSKWTTEFDLSQDLMLENEGMGSFTKMVDSIVVEALKTPGAILYFNEFNTLPIQAQTYLHSLLDAKRQITLKTSGSEVVKAEEGVLIFGSMNPGYPGTNHPNPATRRRMMPIKVEFPEFKRKNNTYAPAEALRTARSVKSLQDLTYNPDMEENEFVKLWDDYINKGISNGKLTPERKFDLEVIFALITFGVQLREGFINKISKKAGSKTFTVSELFSPAHIRRCAIMLSHMDSSKKQNPDNAEAVAKDLIRQFYSQYIFDEKEAEELETNLAQWTTQKPLRSGGAAGTP